MSLEPAPVTALTSRDEHATDLIEETGALAVVAATGVVPTNGASPAGGPALLGHHGQPTRVLVTVLDSL